MFTIPQAACRQTGGNPMNEISGLNTWCNLKQRRRREEIAMTHYEKPLDLVIVALALALTGFSAWSTYLKPRNNIQVLIEGRDRKWIFPLDADETIAVEGPLGNTIVKIHGGQAWVESSPCDNQICVAAGRLHKRGEFAACLPNIVLIMIEGHDDLKKPDGVTW